MVSFPLTFSSPPFGTANSLHERFLAILFVPMAILLPVRLQLRVTGIIAVVVLLYPSVRQSELLPIDRFVEFVESISPERAASFDFRCSDCTRAFSDDTALFHHWYAWSLLVYT